MTDHFRIAPYVALITICAVSIAQANDLPADRQDVVVCLYRNLKAQPAITSVDVFVDDKQNVSIEYTFRDSRGALSTTDLSVSEPRANGRFSFAGDFMYPDNPLSVALPDINKKCNVDGGWDDQVIITGPSDNPQKWLVDMSKYEQ